MANDFLNSDAHNNSADKDEDIDLGELIAVLIESKWLIIGITVIVLLIGIAKVLLITPIYKADAMLQVEESGQALNALGPMSELMDSNVPIQAEIEIIKSRMILGEAVKNLGMAISVQPKHFPVIGKAFVHNFQLNNLDKLSEPVLGYTDYAWGGEKIIVDTFNVPTSWEGKPFIVVAGEQGRYQLRDAQYKLISKSKIGKLLQQPISNESEPLHLFISQLKARVGTHFILLKQPEANLISLLQSTLSVVEKGKGTGILSFTIESRTPLLAMNILNEIANIYVRINAEQKSAEAQKTLQFLEKQLPLIKEQLNVATRALNDYRLEKGSINLSMETESILSGVVAKKTQITMLHQKYDDLRQGFTRSHPAVISIKKQINRLKYQLKEYNTAISSLPEKQQVILRLSRDVKVNTELYTRLLNNLQTLKVAKAGTISDVRIIDYAILPRTPINPHKVLIILIALIAGLLLSIVIVFIRNLLNHGIENPEIIESKLNLPVYATVPHSEIQKKLSDTLKKHKGQGNLPMVLGLENNKDLAIESLRSLRTTLHFAFLEAKNNVIMITGPSPGVGKTFVSTNLAIVLAQAEKKVLLIDADLRKGILNKILGIKREHGLSEVISNDIPPAEAIHTLTDANIDFMSTGILPPNPSELLLHDRLKILLDKLVHHYDYIIIDSPPILAVTDAAILGSVASATLMVVKAGQHPIRELQLSIKRLQQNNVEIKGVIFNDVISSASGYGYGYGKYTYQYDYNDGKK